MRIIFKLTIATSMIYTTDIARMENEKYLHFYFVKPNQKEPHRRILLKLILEEHVIQVRTRCTWLRIMGSLDFVNMTIFPCHKSLEFLDQLGNYQLAKEDCGS